MLVAVVDQMAALAERPQIAGAAIAWIVVEMGGGQDHPPDAHCRIVDDVRPSRWSAAIISPKASLVIEPAAVGELSDPLTMWPATLLAAASGAAEADRGADLRPVDGIEPTEFGADRHGGGNRRRRSGR